MGQAAQRLILLEMKSLKAMKGNKRSAVLRDTHISALCVDH